MSCAQRLYELATEKEELSTQVSLTTRPLLRQLDQMHSSSASQAAEWERQERALLERVREVTARAERAELALEDAKRTRMGNVFIIIAK